MGQIKTPSPVKYFTAVTFQKIEQLKEVEEQLGSQFSRIESKSETFSFDAFTNYYQPEMGIGLSKVFLVFKDIQEAEALAEHKVKTNELEKGFLNNDHHRGVNIDPGYLTLYNLILATTKNFSHRIYLSGGVFGDLHLMFTNKTFNTMPWTYPDYKAHIPFFNEIRKKYHRELFGK